MKKSYFAIAVLSSVLHAFLLDAKSGFRDNYFYVSALPLSYGALVLRPRKNLPTSIHPSKIFIECRLYLSDSEPGILKGNAELGDYNLELKQLYDNAGTFFSLGAEYRIYCSLLDNEGKKIRDLVAKNVLEIHIFEANISGQRAKLLEGRGFSYEPLHLSSSKYPSAGQIAKALLVVGILVAGKALLRKKAKIVEETRNKLRVLQEKSLKYNKLQKKLHSQKEYINNLYFLLGNATNPTADSPEGEVPLELLAKQTEKINTERLYDSASTEQEQDRLIKKLRLLDRDIKRIKSGAGIYTEEELNKDIDAAQVEEDQIKKALKEMKKENPGLDGWLFLQELMGVPQSIEKIEKSIHKIGERSYARKF